MTTNVATEESPQARPWRSPSPPRRVLAIRFQAFGDTVGVLPYLQSLRRRLPHGELDFLTRREFTGIPTSVNVFDHVYALRGRRNVKLQLLSAASWLPWLAARRYDVVVDLQTNLVSRLIRRMLHPPAWSEFDRFSLVPHGERVCGSIRAAGLGDVVLDPCFDFKQPTAGRAVLRAFGWNESDELVVLNPAGFFPTRNWPLDNYVRFARLWLEQRNAHAKFLVLGVAMIADKAKHLQSALGERLLNLVGRTTQAEAFGVLQHATLTLSEDSGLMHMAWTSGRPTVGLLGSTHSAWSRPVGRHSAYLDSSDLPCGNCMSATCMHGDVRCLTRHTPERVFAVAMALLARCRSASVGAAEARNGAERAE